MLLSGEETIPDRGNSVGYKIINHKGKAFMPSLEEQQALINFTATDLLKALFSKKDPLEIFKEKVVANCRGITGDKGLMDNLKK